MWVPMWVSAGIFLHTTENEKVINKKWEKVISNYPRNPTVPFSGAVTIWYEYDLLDVAAILTNNAHNLFFSIWEHTQTHKKE